MEKEGFYCTAPSQLDFLEEDLVRTLFELAKVDTRNLPEDALCIFESQTEVVTQELAKVRAMRSCAYVLTGVCEITGTAACGADC